MIALIYLLGVILSFIIGRYTNRMSAKRNGYEYTLNFVLINIFFAIMSWVGLFCWIILFICDQDADEYEIRIPKWL